MLIPRSSDDVFTLLDRLSFEFFWLLKPIRTEYRDRFGTLSSSIETDTGANASINLNGFTNDRTLELHGSLYGGTKVAIYEGSKLLGYAKINGTEWRYTTPELKDGYHVLQVVFINGGQKQAYALVATVDTAINGTVSSVLSTSEGATQTIEYGGTTSDSTLGLSGKTEAYARVEIYDRRQLLGTTKADALGKWTYVTPDLANGEHELKVHFVDYAGNSKDVGGITATVSRSVSNPPHDWSSQSGWGSVNALDALNNLLHTNYADLDFGFSQFGVQTLVSLFPEMAAVMTEMVSDYGMDYHVNWQWGFETADIVDLWSCGYTGRGVTVAVIDSGIDLQNSDLTGNLSEHSWNFITNNDNVDDDTGHGSFVASEIIAANNGVGLTGAAYDATIMALKVTYADGSSNSDIVSRAIRYAVDHGADIINISMSGKNAGYAYESAIKYASDKNVLLVMAAGNNGGSGPESPADGAINFNNCLAVGALDSPMFATSTLRMATSFSNQAGASEYGFVDAAGVCVLGYDESANLDFWNGTSMAAPIVAATAALLWSADPSATAVEIAKAIYSTAHAVI